MDQKLGDITVGQLSAALLGTAATLAAILLLGLAAYVAYRCIKSLAQ